MSGRRALAGLIAAAALVASPSAALAATHHERVSVRPRVGDVNTTFVYRGSGWRPHARVALAHGALCGTGPCIAPLFFRAFRTDRHGRFRVTEHPAHWFVEDFEGYSICFGYRGRAVAPPRRCRVTRSITVEPPSVAATPATAERFRGNPPDLDPTVTIAARHFKAGSRLRIRIRYPDGRTRVLHVRARRHAGAVGPAAYAPRGGAIWLLRVRKGDPDGAYAVEVTDARGELARTSYVVRTSRG